MHHFANRDGVLHAEAVNLDALAGSVGTPFYCYSTATLDRHYQVFAGAFADVDALVCYAMKANSNQAVIATLAELGAEVEVRRNDELTVEEVEALHPDRILLSPGPCTPGEAGILVPLIRHMAGKAPILGVCLGHQAIGEAFGGQVVRAQHLMHGKTSPVQHDGKGIFAGLSTPLTCTRYHSLIVAEESLPAELTVTARTPAPNGGGSVIMGLRHRTLPIEGVQFHPESVLTEGGHQMIRNFLEM